jgi:hypothetical protein
MRNQAYSPSQAAAQISGLALAAMQCRNLELERMNGPIVMYECGICGCYHPWEFSGDCRDDENRFGSPEEYAEKLGINPIEVEVRGMDERVQADLDGE